MVSKRKLIYIMGCARSGSTILGFILNNGEKCLDLGEVIDFLQREGIPNGFEVDTQNGTFWNGIKTDVLSRNSQLFAREAVQKIHLLEYHTGFPFVYSGTISRKLLQAYDRYINSLYNSIFIRSSDKVCYIDSSKYPTRALLLNLLLRNIDFYVIYLTRNPVGVINSLKDKSKQQGSKNFFSANIYYYIVSFFCHLAQRRLRDKCLKIKYEDLTTRPEETLTKIAHFTGIELKPAIHKVEKKLPLQQGYVFNGNRMRMEDDVVFKTTETGYADGA